MASEILIVDDEADIRDLVAGILQDEGYVTRTARNSDDALNAVVARRPGCCYAGSSSSTRPASSSCSLANRGCRSRAMLT